MLADASPRRIARGRVSWHCELEIQELQLGGTPVAHYDEVMFPPEPSSSLSALAAFTGIIGLASWRRPREAE
jgi:hypothetical protein